MACFHPLSAWQRVDGSVVFVERGDILRSLFLPCGQCRGCRLERSRQWAMRCMHEASLYDSNCFVTLTYDDAHLKSMSLDYRDFMLFMKRLRKHSDSKIRFYMCGEYGDQFSRPHFHACLFNCEFPDKVYFRKAGAEGKLYTSATLEKLWPFGFSLIGAVSFESAAYVARYCVTKVTGQLAEDHYKGRVPEFNKMSLGSRGEGGIGMPWLRKFWSDVYPRGDVVVRGKRVKPPKAYDRLLQKFSDDDWAQLCLKREQFAALQPGENSDERLAVREQVAAARLSFYKRSL